MLKQCRISEKHNIVKKGDIEIQITRNENHILSPSWKVINTWKTRKFIDNIDVAWNIFTQNFINELDTTTAKNEIDRLAKKAIALEKEGNDIYLMCYENTSKYCHRFIVLNLINDHIKKLGGYGQDTLADFM